MRNKTLYSKESCILFFVTLLLSYYICPLFKTPQTDRQVFVYGSMTILKGGVPYKDFFDHKPPLIYLILALGWPFKWWGVWAVGVIAKWISSFYLYRLAAYKNVALKFIVPLTFLVTILNPFIIAMGSFTREYSTIFLAIAVSVILMNPGKKYFVTGILFGLTFFTQQEEMIFYLPFIIWHLCTNTENNFQFKLNVFFYRGMRMLIGFSIVVLTLVSWLYLKDALYSFWEQAFLYNFNIYHPSSPLVDRLERSIRLLYHTRIGFFIILFLILHTYFFIKKNNRELHLIQIISIASVVVLKAFFSRLGEEYDTQHYFLTYSVLFAISSLLVLKEFDTWLKELKWRLLFIGLFTFCCWFFWENAVTSRYTEKEPILYKRMKEILPYVQDIRNKDGQLFVFRTTSYIKLYNELNILSPSKWIYTTTYNKKLKFDKTENVVKDIIDSLDAHRTKYIVDLSVEFPLQSEEMRKEWERYIKANYTAIKIADGYTILQRSNY